MSYEERIKSFWDMSEEKQLSSLARLLGLGMLELWHRRGIPASCGLSNYELANLIGTNEKTVRRLRTELIDAGFIWCYSKKGKLPVYYFDEVAVPEELKEVKPKKKPKPVEVKPKARPKMAKENEPTLWEQNKKTRSELKKSDKTNESIRAHKDKAFEPPTMEMVVGLFIQKGRTEEEARTFYDYFNRQDWYTSNGRNRIRNVESAINYWINSKKNETGREHIAGCTNREKRNRDLQEELIARYGKI